MTTCSGLSITVRWRYRRFRAYGGFKSLDSAVILNHVAKRRHKAAQLPGGGHSSDSSPHLWEEDGEGVVSDIGYFECIGLGEAALLKENTAHTEKFKLMFFHNDITIDQRSHIT